MLSRQIQGKNQDYEIIVIVSLGSNNPGADYNKADISGRLVGTDGYLYNLGDDFGDYNGSKIYPYDMEISSMESFSYDLNKSQAIYRILVPGATIPLTKDSITISSQFLQESQTLEILFGSY